MLRPFFGCFAQRSSPGLVILSHVPSFREGAAKDLSRIVYKLLFNRLVKRD
jgi:hypothetical protein